MAQADVVIDGQVIDPARRHLGGHLELLLI